MMALRADDRLASAGRQEEEVRQLILDLREAARDGRRLAQRYAELLEKVVDEYCVEFEMRAEAVLAKLEAQ